jgi:adenylate kinase family enzyme
MEDERITDILFNALAEPAESGWIIDGFPRTLRQAQLLDAHDTQPHLVCLLDVPRPVLETRIMDRWVHVASGRIYSHSFNPPRQSGIDDLTGEPLVRRHDDEIVSLLSR